MKDFTSWFELKPKLNNKNKRVPFKEREIWWCSIGTNIGHEMDGKGSLINRPILIIKKLSQNMFFGVPLTSNIKEGSWYVSFLHKDKESCAVLSQTRVFHINRLNNKMGIANEDDYEKVMKNLKKLIFTLS